jgi:hypothetical protein
MRPPEKGRIVAIIFIFLTVACAKKGSPGPDYNAFDQSPGTGWRHLAENGQFLDAAKSIDAYIKEHEGLDESQRVNLNFHAGQMYAYANDAKTAIERFDKSTYAEEPPDLPLRWNAYVRATIAFLDKDLNRLKECREEIAAGPTFQGEKANLDVVDRLIDNFDKPYSEAYGGRRNKQLRPPAV